MPTSSHDNSRNEPNSFKCKLWIGSVVVLHLGQIIAGVVVLSVSRHEKPHTPLLAWVLVYMAACLAALPHFFWNWHQLRFLAPSSWGAMDIFAMVLVCFFFAWFPVGCFWIRHASSSHAPSLFWLCVVFLTISGVFYVAFPLYIVVRFCHLLLEMVHRARVMKRLRGASQECIDALPMHEYKSKDNAVPGDDEACCICLTKFVDGDQLRGIGGLCSHLFHSECLDKWLKKRAFCPLCKRRPGPPQKKLVS